jgi:hypothetical protein
LAAPHLNLSESIDLHPEAIQEISFRFPDRSNKMSERRATPRRRVLKTARIAISEMAPKLECTLRNTSDLGGALQVSTSRGLPSNFDIDIDGQRRRCRTAWRSDTKIGFQFDK